MINIIVAMTKNHGIGYNNKLPWYISDDLKRFKKSDFIDFSKKNKLVIKKLHYYDFIGFLLIFANKFILNASLNAKNCKKNIHIWDFLIPLSKLFDFLTFNLLGKSLMCILEKK